MADSYNELFGLGSHSEDANLEAWYPHQDDAASTAVDDVSSNNHDATLNGGDNTSTISTTGPNSYLAKSLDYDGTADYSSVSGAVINEPLTNNALTLAFWTANNDTTQTNTYLCQYADPLGGTADKNRYNIIYGYVTREYETFFSKGNLRETVYTVGAGDTGWHHLVVAFDGSANTLKSWVDGVIDLNTTSIVNLADNGGNYQWAMGASSGSNYHDAKLAGFGVFSRALTAAEASQVYNGPEPVNTAVPTFSGTETEGQTLTGASGTWALDSPFASGSNGTITYAYQWTRSNDGIGTGEADIAGATSSTYTLVAADVGKYIRLRVRASNDGGFDSSADTNSAFSGAIAASGGAALPAGSLALLGVGI